MNQLTIIDHRGVDVVESTLVAEAIEKEHKNLLRDISGYIKSMEESDEDSQLKIEPSEFFIESTFENRGKQYPCYLLTKKGCDMVANKMTGKKGVLFTAAYVSAFEQMRENIQTGYTRLSPQLQLLINMEVEQKRQSEAITAVSNRVDHISELVALNPQSWREECRRLIVRIAQTMGGNEYIRDVNALVFELVDARAGVSLATRLTNKRRRMADEGVCKSKRDKLNKVDVIAEDKKLIEIYIAVVKETAIAHKVEG